MPVPWRDTMSVVMVTKHTKGREAPPTYSQLGQEFGLSASQVHAAVKRCIAAELVRSDTRSVRTNNLLELLVHGVKYVFPTRRGPIGRGVPTAHSGPPLAGTIQPGELPVVWPSPIGTERGESLEPLHKSALNASAANEQVYHALCLVDAIRAGRARERALATERLGVLLGVAA